MQGISRPLLGSEDSPKHVNYSALPSKSANEQTEQTIEEAAAAMRDRLPGRSRKAKGRFRRQQRGQKGEEWRGRLTCYCEASSNNLEKLTNSLREQSFTKSTTSRLYSTRWQVKAYFDVLHLKASVPAKLPIMSKSSSLRLMAGGQIGPSTDASGQSAYVSSHQNNPLDLTGYQTYDTEVSDTEGAKSHNVQVPEVYYEEDTVDVFLFVFGPIVFWGFNDELEEREMLRDLRNFVDGTFHDVKAADDAMEEMEFTYRETSRISNDMVELATFKSGEKLVISSAIAQSCHLSVHEWRLAQTINRNNHIPKELAETGFIQMSSDEISKEIGTLFMEKTLVNLEPELLDVSLLIKVLNNDQLTKILLDS